MFNHLYVIDRNGFFVQKSEKMVALEEFRAVVTLKLLTGKTTHTCLQLSEILASLGITGVQLRAPLESPRATQQYIIEGFKGGPPLGSHYAERDVSLSDSLFTFYPVRHVCVYIIFT